MALTLKRGPKTPERDPNDLTVDLYDWPNPAKPSAVLVPPVVMTNRKARKAKKAAAITLAAATAAAVLSSALTWFLASQSAEELAVAQAEAAVAQARVNKYAPIATYYDGLMAQQQSLTGSLAGDLSYTEMVSKVLEAKPRGVTMERFEVQPGAVCPGPNPFEALSTLGCIQISGTGTVPDVGAFVDALNELGVEEGLVGAFAGSVSLSGTDLAYSLSVSYNSELLSGRFSLGDGADPAASGIPSTDLDETATGGTP